MRKSVVIFAVIAFLLTVAIVLHSKFDKKINELISVNPIQNMSQDQNQTSSNAQNFKAEVIKEGTGVASKNGDKVSVNYIGRLEDGTVFDSNTSTTAPFIFTLGAGEVIKGWDMGVLGMKIGGKVKLTIPSDLAYGDPGYPPVIPAKATLIFEVTLLKIN
jgi:FKBP-type peptidyl-prolyl cis-trans isomerase